MEGKAPLVLAYKDPIEKWVVLSTIERDREHNQVRHDEAKVTDRALGQRCPPSHIKTFLYPLQPQSRTCFLVSCSAGSVQLAQRECCKIILGAETVGVAGNTDREPIAPAGAGAAHHPSKTASTTVRKTAGSLPTSRVSLSSTGKRFPCSRCMKTTTRGPGCSTW